MDRNSSTENEHGVGSADIREPIEPEASSTSPPAIPDHILLRRIGRGSYGSVWLARNMMGIYRAIKVVERRTFSDDRPFERELSGIRKFEPISRSHEGFVDVLHIGINEDKGYFYYVMELGDDQISGQMIDPEQYRPKTLGTEITVRQRLSYQECLELGLGLSRALAELHKHGLVHRDVKPSNIIFVNGVPKLADIGLVAEAKEERCSYVGTAGFIPPEGPGSAQADVYGLGKVLYEMSTGKDRQEFPELPTKLASLSERDSFLELNEVVLHACKNDKDRRYQSAWDMHADLVVLANGRSVKRLKTLERRLSRIKRIAGISALALTGVVIVLYQVYRQWKAADEARQRDVGSSIAYGNRAMESQDLLGALPYFADALQSDEPNARETINHRLRFGSVLTQCPKLTQMWFEGRQVQDGQFSPDGKSILIAHYYGDARIFDLETGAMKLHPFSENQRLMSAAYSHNGAWVVTAGENGWVCVWSADTLALAHRWHEPNAVLNARFSPDDTHVVTACNDGCARIRDWRVEQTISLFDHKAPLRYADFSKDGRYIVTGGIDGTACIWDAATHKRIGKRLQHAGWVNAAGFSPDGKRLVTASGDHKARAWDLESSRQISPDLNHRDAVTSAEFSPDGRLLLTGSLDGTVRLWCTDHFQPLEPNPILRHGEKVLHAAFDSDGRRIVAVCADGSVRVWDLAGSALSSVCSETAFSRDGNRGLYITNNSIVIREVASTAAPLIIHPAKKVERADFSFNGRFVLSTSVDQTNPAWSKWLLQAWDARTASALSPPLVFTNSVSGATLGDDGQRVAIFRGNMAQPWDLPTQTALSPPLIHDSTVSSVFFSPTGIQMGTINGKYVHIWNTETGQSCFPPLSHPATVRHAEFNPFGSLLVSCFSDPFYTKCYAQVWNAATGQAAGPPLAHGDGVLFVQFSLDATRVATASEDFTANVWETASGRQLTAPALQHNEKVASATLSPDNRWVVSASLDRTARVWNAENGDPLTPFLPSISILTNAQFLADGHQIVAFDSEGIGHIWKLSIDSRPVADLRELARLLSGDLLTSSHGLAPQRAKPLATVWQEMKAKYGPDFTVSNREIAAWHELQAQASEKEHNWTAVIFHLERLRSLRPGDPTLVDRLARATALLKGGE